MEPKTRALLLLCLVAYLDYAAMGLVFPLFSSMLYAPGSLLLNEAATDIEKGMWLGILLSSLSLTQLISAPIFGSLSDRYGRKKMLLLTQIIGIVGYVLSAIAAFFQCIQLLLLSRIIVGIACAWSTIESAALSDISSRKSKMQNFGYLGMSCGLGFATGPYIGGTLLDIASGFTNPYIFPFILAALVILFNAYMVKQYFPETLEVNKPQASLQVRMGVIKRALARPSFAISLFIVFFFYLGWSSYWNFSPVIWMSKHGFSPADVSRMYAYGSIAYAICSGALIQPIVRYFSAKPILVFSLLLCACSFGGMLFDCESQKLWYYVPFQQYILSLFSPTITSLISNMTHREEQGEALGIFYSMHAVGDALGPLLSSPLMSLDVRSPLLVGMVCMVAAAMTAGFFMPAGKNQVTPRGASNSA